MRPYTSWLQRQIAIARISTGILVIATLPTVGVTVWAAARGEWSLAVCAFVTALILSIAAGASLADVVHLRRALDAWNRGESELAYLPKRLQERFW